MHKTAFLSLVLLLGCAKSTEPADPIIGDDDTTSAELSRFDTCAELEGYLQRVAEHEMEQTLDLARRGEGWGWGWGDDLDAEGGADADGDADRGASEPEHSDTNVQEEGVDEADIVKTDGNHIYVLTSGYFLVFDSYPAEDLHEVSRIEIDGAPIEMFVHGDEAVVFTRVQNTDVPPELARTFQGGPCDATTDSCTEYRWATKITVLDVVDRAVPTVSREIYAEANYVSSRRIDDSVHVVLAGYQSGPPLEYWPEDLDFAWYDRDRLTPAERQWLDYEYARMEVRNRNAIRSADLEWWVPRSVEIEGEERNVRLLASCDEFYRPGRLGGRGVLSVTTIRLGTDRPVHHAAVVGHGGVVYASQDSLYVATHPWYSWWGWWGWWGDTWREERSFVHKFDLGSDPDRARYVASGAVPGHVLNQFSMSEQDGFLRMATSTFPLWTGDGGVDSQNHLFVLEEEEGKLEVVGEVRDLAPGEQVYSARFLEDRGFVVTFRQMDPLFAFDLSNPRNPRLEGELHITGFSTYMHPLDDSHLLTIGQETNEEGWIEGMALSIFDVSDLTSPELAHRHLIGEGGGWSEAMYNHKAFSYFRPLSLLAIPVSTWDGDWDRAFIGAKVFRIDVEDGIEPIADIDHSAYYDERHEWYYGWYSQVRRTLTIEDHLYSLSGRALVANPLDDLSTTTAFAVLPEPVAGGYYGW